MHITLRVMCPTMTSHEVVKLQAQVFALRRRVEELERRCYHEFRVVKDESRCIHCDALRSKVKCSHSYEWVRYRDEYGDLRPSHKACDRCGKILIVK